MKKSVALVIVTLLTLGVLVVAGCASVTAANKTVPPLDARTEPAMLTITYDDFIAQRNISQEIEVKYPGSIIISLAANPSTGFAWEDAVIQNGSVVQFYERNYVAPAANAVGAAGKEVWTFKSEKQGITVIDFTYSRPWEGGEKAEWTLTLTVNVK